MFKCVTDYRIVTSTALLKTGIPLGFTRCISLSAVDLGTKNFRQFFVGNKRGTRAYKEKRAKDPDFVPDIPIYTEVKPIGYRYGKTFRKVPEMIPEIVVPDLTGFKLKPYVSYKAAEIIEAEFTPKDLFYYVYQKKIERDFAASKLDENGNSLEPSDEEKLTAEEARIMARKSGSDIFSERIPRRWECLENPEKVS